MAAGLPAADAEDVCQEVLLSALRDLDHYRGCRLSTWLYRISRRRIADHLRAPGRRELPLGMPGDRSFPRADDSTRDSEVAAGRTAECERLRHEVAGLDEPERSIVIAYYAAELSIREIAAELGMPENTVKSHLRRARLLLRKRLEEE